jgi:molybdate/tungstate transport system substrate-binding protein
LTKQPGTEKNAMKTVKSLLLVTLALAITFVLALAAGSCSKPEKTKVRVLCANSLMYPLDRVEKAFEALHPDVDILTEGHGSIQVIRHVTELHEESDLVIVADDSLIPMMMYDTKIPDTDQSYTDWYIKFATNTLGIAYSANSKYAGEINERNWYKILARPDIKLGFADARLDACGYYTLMTLALSELYYGDDSILENVLGPFNPPLKTSMEGTVTTITVPEILRPDSDKTIVRGSSIRLLALLDSGDIDYSFEYRSVAEQQGLKFIELPPEINLGSSAQADFYGHVKCVMEFQRFATVRPEFTGEPIIYGITIPRNAPHKDIALEYLEFLLGMEGQKIFASSHHPMIPPAADNPANLPLGLETLLKSLGGG